MEDRGKLMRRRDDAADWVSYARWAAIAMAVVACLLIIMRSSASLSATTVAAGALYVAIGLVGFCLRVDRPWAAWLLILLITLTFVLNALSDRLLSSLLPRLAVVFVCVKGAIAVFQYQNVSRMISMPSVSEEGKAAALEVAHHGLGITSFTVSVAAGTLMTVTLVTAGVLEANTPGAVSEPSPTTSFIGGAVILLFVAQVFALALGIAGIRQKERKRVFAILGTIFSSVTVILTIVLVVWGLNL